MIEISKKIEGNVVIEKDTNLRGMIVGNVEVLDGATLYLRGSLNGRLYIYEGAKVLLYGTNNGDVINDGGILEVFGVINGRLFRERGRTLIDDNALVEEM